MSIRRIRIKDEINSPFLSRPIWILGWEEKIGSPDLLVGREREFTNVGKWIDNIPKKLSRSRVALARRKSGKTVIVQRILNQLRSEKMLHLRKILRYLNILWVWILYSLSFISETSYYTSIGTFYYELRKHKKAIWAFKSSELSHGGNRADVSSYNYCYMGYCYMDEVNYRKAIHYFELYLDLNGHDYDILSYLGWCYESMGEFEKALNFYSQGIKNDPTVFNAYLDWARVILVMNRKKEALTRLESALKKIHDPLGKKLVWCMTRRIEGRFAEAVNALRDVIDSYNPDDDYYETTSKLDFYCLLTECQRESGDLPGVLATLNVALNDIPGNIWTINELAKEYADQNIQLDRALGLIRLLMRQGLDNSVYLDTEGWILYKMGRIDEAKEVFERCLALSPDYKIALDHYRNMQD